MENAQICSITCCPNNVKCRSWCTPHYNRWRRYGDPLAGKPLNRKTGKPCEAKNCDRKSLARGLCSVHYSRIRLKGTLEPSFNNARVTTIEERLTTKSCRRENGCLEWTGKPDSKGYGTLTFQKETDKPYRWAWRTWVGPIPEGLSVLHKCDNPSCIEPSHLEIGTKKKNNDDAFLRGRRLPKLNAEQVIQMREQHAQGIEVRELAYELGVSQTTVRNRLRYSIIVDGPRPPGESEITEKQARRIKKEGK